MLGKHRHAYGFSVVTLYIVSSLAFPSATAFSFNSRSLGSTARTKIFDSTTPSFKSPTPRFSTKRNYANKILIRAQVKTETKNDEHRQINLDWDEIQKQASLFSKMALPYFK